MSVQTEVGRQLVTAEQLWEMTEVPGMILELVDGEIVEMPAHGVLHNLMGSLIFKLVVAHARANELGLVFTDGLGYILARDPDRMRVPDISYVSRSRIPEGDLPRGYWELAPDLAVEIVSPTDRAAKLWTRVRNYLDAGTRMVWVVWPDERAVTVYTQAEHKHLGPNDELDGGDVLPGFSVRVGALFEIER